MPLQPVVGRPAALAHAGASLAAHTANRELPTAGPFARAAAAPAAAPAPAADKPAAVVEAPAAAGEEGGDAPAAIDVRGLTFCYPDIGKGERG